MVPIAVMKCQHICTCILPITSHLVDVLLVGATLFKKHKAQSFQIRSGWNLPGLMKTTSSQHTVHMQAGWLQDSHLGLPFVVRHGCVLPGRWLSAVVWRRSSSAAFCRLEDLCRQATLGTDVSRLPAQGFGTAFQLVLGKCTSAMKSLSGC